MNSTLWLRAENQQPRAAFGVVMSDDWKIYRTRFVVRARQLTQPFTFTDINGREIHGYPGDYLVQSSDGPRISRREVFEDVYVTMDAGEGLPSRSPDREAREAQSGGHGFSRAESNTPLIRALAPVQPPAEQVNPPSEHSGTRPFGQVCGKAGFNGTFIQ